MNADILQIVFDFADVEERIVMRRIFGEIFRYPQLQQCQMLNIFLKSYRVDHRIEKRMCYFGGHERIETFVNKHGMYANISLGAVCIFPLRISAACTKPYSLSY